MWQFVLGQVRDRSCTAGNRCERCLGHRAFDAKEAFERNGCLFPTLVHSRPGHDVPLFRCSGGHGHLKARERTKFVKECGKDANEIRPFRQDPSFPLLASNHQTFPMIVGRTTRHLFLLPPFPFLPFLDRLSDPCTQGFRRILHARSRGVPDDGRILSLSLFRLVW